MYCIPSMYSTFVRCRLVVVFPEVRVQRTCTTYTYVYSSCTYSCTEVYTVLSKYFRTILLKTDLYNLRKYESTFESSSCTRTRRAVVRPYLPSIKQLKYWYFSSICLFHGSTKVRWKHERKYFRTDEENQREKSACKSQRVRVQLYTVYVYTCTCTILSDKKRVHIIKFSPKFAAPTRFTDEEPTDRWGPMGTVC